MLFLMITERRILLRHRGMNFNLTRMNKLDYSLTAVPKENGFVDEFPQRGRARRSFFVRISCFHQVNLTVDTLDRLDHANLPCVQHRVHPAPGRYP
jgi:hypothetical protein